MEELGGKRLVIESTVATIFTCPLGSLSSTIAFQVVSRPALSGSDYISTLEGEQERPVLNVNGFFFLLAMSKS